MGVLELIQQKAFIGAEFLTWLWFRSERDHKVTPHGGEPVTIELLGPIVLEAQYGDARSGTLKGDSPATSPEARTALLEGKKLKRAKMKWTRGDVAWTVTLDGETFNLTGLAIPMPGRLPPEEAIALRMAVLLDFERLLDQLFQHFLELRLDAKAWGKELNKIHAWVREK
jgi:hypothetical protein